MSKMYWDPSDHTKVAVLIEHKQAKGYVVEERLAGQVRYYPRAHGRVYAGPFATFAEAEHILNTQRPPSPPELDYYALKERTVSGCR